MTIRLEIPTIFRIILETVPQAELAEIKNLLKQILSHMSQLDDQIASLKTEVENETTVEQSALKLIQGIPALIADAVAKAQAAGATPEQLQALTDLKTKLAANDVELAAGVTAGTPSA